MVEESKGRERQANRFLYELMNSIPRLENVILVGQMACTNACLALCVMHLKLLFTMRHSAQRSFYDCTV